MTKVSPESEQNPWKSKEVREAVIGLLLLAGCIVMMVLYCTNPEVKAFFDRAWEIITTRPDWFDANLDAQFNNATPAPKFNINEIEVGIY